MTRQNHQKIGVIVFDKTLPASEGGMDVFVKIMLSDGRYGLYSVLPGGMYRRYSQDHVVIT